MVLMLLALVGATAVAGPAETRDSLYRMRDVLELRLEDGRLSREALRPAIVVGVEARYSESEGWLLTQAIEVLQSVVGPGNLRICEACMAPRTWVGDGVLNYQTGPIGLDEVVRLDDSLRGDTAPARAGIWIEEHPSGVSVRIVDLRTGGVLFAQNLDPALREAARTEHMFQLTEELERRARGEGLTHTFLDLGLYPQQHIGIDWSDQFGRRNQHLSGFSISILDPLVGIGGNYYFVTPLLHTLVGVKAIASLPTALVRSLGEDVTDGAILDPLVSIVGVVRVPFGRSNYGALATLSTNGRFCLGISLMNTSAVPVIP